MSPRSLLSLLAAALAANSCGGGGGSGPSPTPPHMAANAGDNQTGVAGQPLATPLSVILRDASNTPTSGVTITWAMATGGCSVNPASSTTGTDGIASTVRTLGPTAGTQTTTASASNVTGSPVTFTSTAQIQGATQIALNGGNNQSGTAGTALGTPYSVIVREQNNTPVPGVVVNWAVTSGGGSVSSATSTSDASGIASVTRTLGTTAGTQSAQASVTGLIGSPVSFTATATPGSASQLVKSGGDNQTGSVNTALPVPLSVTAQDQFGNGVSGATVTWAVTSGGGSVSPAQNTSGSSGVASATFTLGPTVGTQTARATSAGLAGSPLTFTATAAVPVTVGPGIVFSPTSVTVPVGGAVIWTWAAGSLPHGVQWLTAPAGAKPTDSATQTSGTYSWTFNTAGIYTYDCVVHGSSMTGSVTVP